MLNLGKVALGAVSVGGVVLTCDGIMNVIYGHVKEDLKGLSNMIVGVPEALGGAILTVAGIVGYNCILLSNNKRKQ